MPGQKPLVTVDKYFRIKEEVIKVYWRMEAKYPVEIRIARFITNGKATDARLERRYKIYRRSDGREINGRVTGFSLEDLRNVIAPNIEDITRELEHAVLTPPKRRRRAVQRPDDVP